MGVHRRGGLRSRQPRGSTTASRTCRCWIRRELRGGAATIPSSRGLATFAALDRTSVLLERAGRLLLLAACATVRATEPAADPELAAHIIVASMVSVREGPSRSAGWDVAIAAVAQLRSTRPVSSRDLEARLRAIRRSTQAAADIARRYDVDPSLISRIRSGAVWRESEVAA
jgi:hypothetical protein